MNAAKKTIVAVGLYVPGTGFTRVLTSLFSRLSADFNIHWLGVGYRGDIIHSNYTLYPTNLEGGDVYAAFQMAEYAEQFNADAIFLLNDFWMLKNYRQCLESLEKRIPCIAYVPLDGKIDRAEDIENCAFVDHIVCYNKLSLEQSERAFNKLFKQKKINRIPALHTIYHGTDLNEFSILPPRNNASVLNNRKELKEKLFPNLVDPENSFIVLNANRIAIRKALHLTLAGFSAFAQNKSNAFLCLHVPNTPERHLSEFIKLIDRYGLSEKVLLNPLGESYVANNTLNELYNACDVGINTSMGEGWGMISFEHAATGAAQIVPEHTACKELWKDYGLLTKVAQWKRVNNNPFLMGEIDPSHLAQQLQSLYEDPEHLLKISNLCFERATSTAFDWNNISNQWSALLQKVKSKKNEKSILMNTT